MWVKPEDYKLVGDCLTAARRQAGVSQDELAALLGKPQSFISTYERGQRRIDLLEFLLIMNTLNADPAPVFAEIARDYKPRKRG